MHNLVDPMKAKHKVTQNHNVFFQPSLTAVKRRSTTPLVSGTKVRRASHLGICVPLCIPEYTDLCI